MSVSIDRLPDNEIATRIAKLKKQLQEMQSIQTMTSASVRLYRVSSSQSSDITLTNVTQTLYTVHIVFTPNDTTYPNLGLVYHLEYVPTITGSGASDVWWRDWWLERIYTNNTTSEWYLYIIGASGGPTINLKLYFFANGSGTFTVNKV